MKTLDEVINIFEKACDLERRCEDCSGCLGHDEGCPNDGANAVPDALHYLKEYRSEKAIWEDYRKNLSDMVMQRAKAYEDAAKRLIEKYKELDIGMLNPPLSWDELCRLDAIGEPVWNGRTQRWMLLIDSANDGSWIELINHAGGKERWIELDLRKNPLYRRPVAKSER